MSRPKSNIKMYDFFARKRGPETKTPSNEAAENTVSCPTLPQTTEISRRNSEGDAYEHQSSTSCPAKKKQKSGVRPYIDDFLKFQFVNCSDAGHTAIPMCVICGEKLAN